MNLLNLPRLLKPLLPGALCLLLAACLPAAANRSGSGASPWVLPAEPPPPRTGIRMETPPQETAPRTGPLKISLEGAVLLSLENNRSLEVERLNPEIQQTLALQERGAFDPVTEAELSYQRADTRRQTQTEAGSQRYDLDTFQGAISLRQFFPSGTSVELEGASTTADSSLYSDPLTTTRLGLSVSQALLRGYGPGANLARLRQTELETRISAYELRGFSQTLVARVEEAYWDYALARRQVEIVEESLKVANQQLVETEQMIQVGSMAEAELAAVQAEVASQQQSLINARSSLANSRLLLLRLLNPPGEGLWEREVGLVHQPTIPEVKLDPVADHVAVALRMRPEINQTKLEIQKGDLEIVRTRNGLLPRLDLFLTLGKTGYSDSFGGSLSDLTGHGYDLSVGLGFQYPLFNRAAKAGHQRALLQREQAEKALANLSQLVELDVRTAYIEVERTKEQITASTATRKFQEEKLRIEQEKFRVGRSTSFLVSQAQRDLLASRISEVQSVANYLKALIDLYRLDGSLLIRRSISAPGSEPVQEAP